MRYSYAVDEIAVRFCYGSLVTDVVAASRLSTCVDSGLAACVQERVHAPALFILVILLILVKKK